MRDDRPAISAITKILSEYRQGEIGCVTSEHVWEWVMQFPSAIRLGLLNALSRALPRIYLSRAVARQCCAKILVSDIVWRGDFIHRWRQCDVLRLQAPGRSQDAILDLLHEVAAHEKNINLNVPRESARDFLYLDDACLTGRTLIRDLARWLREAAQPGYHLTVVALAATFSGFHQARAVLQPLANRHGVQIRFLRLFSLASGLVGTTPLFTADELVYLTPVLRDVGLHIRAVCRRASAMLPPLGFQANEQSWADTLFLSWRNIPNNAPLAFWWGRPDWPGTTLAAWTPLFPRLVASQEGMHARRVA